jgi:hypothetical protein
MRRVRRVVRYLIVKADIGKVVRNVLFGMPVDRFFKFVLAHRRQDDVLDDDRVSANAGHDLRGVDLKVGADVLDNIGNDIELHYLAVNDSIVGQVLVAEGNQTKLV